MMIPVFNNVTLGTSGYVFDDWVGSFYPPKLPRKEWLRFYAQEFSLVEINATYYRMPTAAMFSRMQSKTPQDFQFVVKANQDMTHKRMRSPDLYLNFLRALDPLRSRGQLRGVLLQFPFGFHKTEAAKSHLEFVRSRFRGIPVWAEFRHSSWNLPGLAPFLENLDLGFCAVDEPALPRLMPPVAHVTNGLGYVRFHGRNAATWYGGGHERYDWDYSRGELESWLNRIRFLSEQSEATLLFFNNCYLGRAVRSARLMGTLLGKNTGPLELFAS